MTRVARTLISSAAAIKDRNGVVMDVDLLRAVRSAATAELAWTEDAAPAARAVVPLARDDTPVLAVPYADASWARSVATRPRVVLTISDRRLCGPTWRPLRLTAAPRLVEDREGGLFTEELLPQELRKHPPSRALADSPLLRREHWWYLPRLLLHLDVVATEDFPERTPAQDDLLVTVQGDAVHCPVVQAVRVTSGPRPNRLTGLDGADVDDCADALVFGHDFTCPDLERWVSWAALGPVRSGVLDADLPVARAATGMPGLRERLRRQRDLHRACLRGLRHG